MTGDIEADVRHEHRVARCRGSGGVATITIPSAAQLATLHGAAVRRHARPAAVKRPHNSPA